MYNFTKNFLLTAVLLIAPAVLRADNAVEMVTFFPTTYTTYDNLYIAEKLYVIGPVNTTTTVLPFTLDLGKSIPSESNAPALATEFIYMQKNSKLILHNFDNIISDTVFFAKNATPGAPTLVYKDKLTWMNDLGNANASVGTLQATQATIGKLMFKDQEIPAFPTDKMCTWDTTGYLVAK